MKLCDLISVSCVEKPCVNFEDSLDNDQVVSGYVPVHSTLDALSFLAEATAAQAPRGRAVICHGPYGSGKSRLCTVLARLFRDGFETNALQPVWKRLEGRGEIDALKHLRDTMMPASTEWHPWLVVPIYAGGGAGTLSAALVRGLLRALRRNQISEAVLGRTIYHAAAERLQKLVSEGATYQATPGIPFATAKDLKRALEEDLDDAALAEFRSYHKRVTHGIDFLDVVQASNDVALQADQVFNTVAEGIQQYGYQGIIVIWDEFGFALEELLRDTRKGLRSLGQEAMSLQEFVEKSCGTNELGKRVLFLGFTHLSISEYGSRAGLDQTDRNRLNTVSDRFRQPSVFIRLSVTENEGYHLLGGMIQRTDCGRSILGNPVPRLQRLADRMPHYRLWETLSAETCYRDIAALCYPLHPTAASALLLLSDQIAQVNRTTFYYLQNRDEGGLAGALDSRDIASLSEVGGDELLRLPDLYGFFQQAIRESQASLSDQYEEATARFPECEDFDLEVLRSVLILTVIRSRDVAPTTDVLSFALCDARKDEDAAKRLHQSLERLSNAQALWKNDATEVWSFVGGRGLGADLERQIEDELGLVASAPACELLRKNPLALEEIADRLGDYDLDPCETGVVRTIGIRMLDIAKGDRAVEPVNPAVSGTGDWRSALVYLVAVDTAAQLEGCRQHFAALSDNNVYFVFPPNPVAMNAEKVRQLIAVQNLLRKTDPGSQSHGVLEGKLTKLRRDLREEFERCFGNEGLRSGTSVERAGRPAAIVSVTSWNELLPSIASDLAAAFPHQLKVRCGTYNQWQSGSQWAAIQKVVERILRFEENPHYQAEYLGFSETSQEAAVVDGVLQENSLLIQNQLTGKWELITPTPNVSHEALREVLRHFQAGGTGDKDVRRLFVRLIEPPYGIPNGIMPLLVSLAFRAEEARIGVYEKRGSQSVRVTDAQLPDAIVGMARSPSRYSTRYNKLSGKQRFVFKALGPEMDVRFSEQIAVGEKFYAYCEQVRDELKDWVCALPEGVLSLSDLTDVQRRLLKSLRGPVPPQLPLLADSLVEVIQEDPGTQAELADAGNRMRIYPEIRRLWRDLRAKIDRYVEGVKAPVRQQLREFQDPAAAPEEPVLPQVVAAIRKVQAFAQEADGLGDVAARLDAAPVMDDPVEQVAAAISGKSPANLTDEDYGRAIGMLEVVRAVGTGTKGGIVLLIDGARKELAVVSDEPVISKMTTDVEAWSQAFSLTKDQLAAAVIRIIYGTGDRAEQQEELPGPTGQADDVPESDDDGEDCTACSDSDGAK